MIATSSKKATNEAMCGPYRVHPALAVFPMVDDRTFALIVQSIRHSGLREPITLSYDQTTMVDGRIRYAACEAAMVDPVFTRLPEDYTELDTLHFIASMNLYRQHLTPEQVKAAYRQVEEMRNQQEALW